MITKCQVFTPAKVAEELLDIVQYSKNIVGKTILENTCGDGSILKCILNRYIKECKYLKYSNQKIRNSIERDIYGIELDKNLFNQCLNNLNKLCEGHGINNISWNIYNSDSLKINFNLKFDYIIGNPPYISYVDLPVETRDYLRSNFFVCNKGKFDYYFAFIEKALKLLSNNGILSYIIPNNIFKVVSGNAVRSLLLKDILKIYDYRNTKLFNVLTSSAIIVYQNNSNNDNIEYINTENSSSLFIDKADLTKKWIFIKKDNLNPNKQIKFGNIFQISMSIVTSYNKAFIINDFIDKGDYIVSNDLQIEKGILRKAASPRSMALSKKEHIIFPYKKCNNSFLRYSESELMEYFPNAFIYLSSFKEQLINRDSEKGVLWYEYGRSQGFNYLNKNKLLMSSVITNIPKIYEINYRTIPYSGIYIAKKSKYSLDSAKQILLSNNFLQFVKNNGISVNGNSIRISVKDIQEYLINMEEVEYGSPKL